MSSSAPPPPRLMWRVLLGVTSGRTRTLMAAGAVLGVAGRLALVGAAITIGRGEAGRAALIGTLAALVFVVQRALLTAARVGAECDLYRAAARALLDTDVLAVPTEDLQRVVFETNYHGRVLVAVTMPTLVADVVAALVITPLLVAALPGRVLAIAAIGLAVVMASLLALRRVTRRLQERLVEATQYVSDSMLVAVDGRVELVARGGEDAFARSLEGTLGTYARVATRSSLGTAILGRAPLLLGAASVGAVAAIDSTSRAALGGAVVAEALFLAASMPVLLGVVLGANDLVRTGPLLGPLVALLGAPRRPELSFSGSKAPSLPVPFAFEDVTFTYAEGAAPALEHVSATWPVDRPLMVVGANGGGKSTLLRLLLGLRGPTAGVVRAGTASLAEIDIKALRRQVAYLPQRPYLGEAYASVREAMLLGRRDVSDDDLTARLAQTGLLEALRARHEDPLAVRVGELSAGQRQRVALARVLLQDARIVILDEPDANLDRAGVLLVAELVRTLTAAGTMVAIAAHTPELGELGAQRIEVAPRS